MQNKPVARAIVAALRIFMILQLAGVVASMVDWTIAHSDYSIKRFPAYLDWIGDAYLDYWFSATALFEFVALAVTVLIACGVYVRASNQLEETLERRRMSTSIRKDIATGNDDAVRGLTINTGRSNQPRPYDLRPTGHEDDIRDDDTSRWFENSSNNKGNITELADRNREGRPFDDNID